MIFTYEYIWKSVYNVTVQFYSHTHTHTHINML